MKKVNIEKIEELRKSKCYSCEEMSYKMNYASRSTYRLKKTCKRKFTLNDLLIISELFDCSVDSLVENIQEEN